MNQSSLKILLNNPSQFKNIIDGNVTSSDTDFFAFGTAVDVLKTEGASAYRDKFAVITKMPSDTIKLIVNMVYDSLYDNHMNTGSIIDNNFDNYTSLIGQAANKVNYQANWKLQTRIDKIIKEGGEYFRFLVDNTGKIFISEYDDQQAKACYMAIESNEFHIDLLNQGSIKYKQVIEFEMKGVQMKAELDAIIINEKEKYIIPIDYKTSGQNVLFFNSSFWKFRYDFQAAAYTEALRQKYPGYEIKPFKFIVINKDYPTPIIYTVTSEVLGIGLNGGILSNGKRLEGVNQSLNRYKWHIENDEWQYPMEYYMNKSLNIIV